MIQNVYVHVHVSSYSEKFSREKTFANFTDLCSATKVFGGMACNTWQAYFGESVVKESFLDTFKMSFKYFQKSKK